MRMQPYNILFADGFGLKKLGVVSQYLDQLGRFLLEPLFLALDVPVDGLILQ